MNSSKISDTARIFKNTEISNSIVSDFVIIGDNTIIKQSNIGCNTSINRDSYVYKSTFGQYCYTGRNATILSSTIGKFCSLAWNVSIGGGNHDFDKITTLPEWRFEMLDKRVLDHEKNTIFKERRESQAISIIGNDVWIATNAIILKGVNIGNGAIIAAGAVVVKDVEPYSIVGGVPAKKIGFRFNQERIFFFEKIKWWNWPIETIRNNRELIFCSPINQDVMSKLEYINSKIVDNYG